MALRQQIKAVLHNRNLFSDSRAVTCPKKNKKNGAFGQIPDAKEGI
jgi:hypothetical protein